jgi:hypothetical protein
MRNDYGTRPYIERYGSTAKKANSRLDESLGMRDGKESTKSQSYKSRRDESRGMK